MNSIFASVSLALATTAMPFVAAAQDSAQEQPIVVTGKYQSDWNKGSSLQAQGLTELQESQKSLVKFSADVVNAQNARDAAQAQALNSRSEFQTLVSQAMSITDPDRARNYGKEINNFAKAWENYNDRVQASTSDLDKASKEQRKAQAAVDKAQTKVDRGRAMMTDAERLSQARR